MAPVSVEGIDRLIKQMDAAYKRVLDAQGSTVKLPSAELNLLSIIGNIRDAFLTSLKSSSREMLDELFGGSCTRVAHIRALIDVLELSPMNASDQRLRGCLNACVSVKEVLIDMGLADVLQKAEEEEKEALEAAGGSFKEPKPEETSPTAEAEAAPASEAPEPAPAPTPPEETPVVDKDAASMDVRPPLGEVVEEEWAELMAVAVCKIGCGRRVMPGTTRSGKAFDTCCRGCATGNPHHKLCGFIDPAKVGEGMCKNGCGRPCAEGVDKQGWKLINCCKGCANGGDHEEWCKPVKAPAPVEDTTGRKDERTFFTEVKSTLDGSKFNLFLVNCRRYTQKEQTVEETVDKVGDILGKEKPLAADFESLLRERAAVLEKA